MKCDWCDRTARRKLLTGTVIPGRTWLHIAESRLCPAHFAVARSEAEADDEVTWISEGYP